VTLFAKGQGSVTDTTSARPSYSLQVDAIIYDLQSRSGITVYTEETVRALAAFGDIAIDYVVTPAARSRVTGIIAPELIREQAPRKLERIRRFRLSDAALRPTVFHSSYYRLPNDRVPTVVTVHDLIHELHITGLRSKVLALQKYQAMKHADAIIAISESTRSDIVNHYPEFAGKRIEVIYNGVSDAFTPPRTEARARSFVFVGSRKHYKNFDFAIAVMARLPGYALQVIGGGPLSEHEQTLLDRSLKGRYQFRGQVSQQELIELYQTSLALLYPSRYEGFGLPALEAMKCGCIPIARNTSSLPEVLGEAGILLENEDADDAAKRISNKIKGSTLAELQAFGFAQAERFSWASTARSMHALYKSLQ
jgi:mannosyltransferase